MLVPQWIKMKTGIDIPEEVVKNDPLLSSDHRPDYNDIPIIIANIPTLGYRCVYTKSYEDLISPESSPFPGKTRIDQSLLLLKNEQLEEALLWCLPKERYLYCLPSVFSNRSAFLKILRNSIYEFSKNKDTRHPLVWVANTVYHDYDWNDELLASIIKGEVAENIKIHIVQQAITPPNIDHAISVVLKEALLYG